MEYVYMQQPKPADVVGVQVVVEVLDSNNNYYEVGRTTSDENGFFKLAFTPQVPGEYSIYAKFAGSESYWPSSAVTAINVEEAPAPTATPSPAPASLADQYFLPGIGGIIAAIAIVGIILAILTMRKK
jgi:hypothetical protein